MEKAPEKNPLGPYVRYTSMGIQMLVIIFLGVFGGYWLDRIAGTKPLLTILLSLAGVSMAIYHAVKDLLKSDKKKDLS